MRLRDRFYFVSVETIYGPANIPVRVRPGETARGNAVDRFDIDELILDRSGRARLSASRITLAEYDGLTH